MESLENFDDAILDYTKALKINDKMTDAYYNRAKIMLEKIELATNDAQKKKYEKALYLGLQAFHSEVVYDEN